jgi:hypothetical protein
MARCKAVRLNLKEWRCRKQAGDKWFCEQHRRWPLNLAITLISTLFVTIGGGWLVAYSWGIFAPETAVERSHTKHLEHIEGTQDTITATLDTIGKQTAGVIEHYATPSKNEPAFKEVAGQLPMLTFGCLNLMLDSDDLYKGSEMPFLSVRGPSAGQIESLISMTMKDGVLLPKVNLFSPKSGAAFSLTYDGHYTLYAPNWDVNYNASAIEVVNEYGYPVFQMIRINNTAVTLVGFTQIFGITTLFGPHGEIGSFKTTESATQATGKMLAKIFAYPAWKNMGRLAESTDTNREACPPDLLGRFGMITKGITIDSAAVLERNDTK